MTCYEAGLVAYYRLNEGVGATVYDSTPNHHDATVVGGPAWAPSGSLTCHPWNGTNGGVLAFLARTVTLNNFWLITADGKGYRGGGQVPGDYDCGYGITGERTTGFNGTNRATDSLERVQGGGGAGRGADGSGGGGAYGTSGANGGKVWSCSDYGREATAFGTNTLSRLYPGGGGGGSGSHNNSRIGVGGGAGGGVVVIGAGVISGNGAISSRGAAGAAGQYVYDNNSGGGGAGGSVYVMGNVTNSIAVSAMGGAGGPRDPNAANSNNGGAGGVGRIRLDVPTSTPAFASVSPLQYRVQLSASNTVTAFFWDGYNEIYFDLGSALVTGALRKKEGGLPAPS